jgi:transcriptional regulator with XRE-family HTH domain
MATKSTANAKKVTSLEKLISVRKALGWTQEQMAGTLGLDRSYLSMLESGRRPLSDSIVNRAVAVMYEARRLDRSPDLQAVKEWVSKMSTDSLITVYEYVVERLNSAPPHVRPFYRFINGLLMRELTARFDLSLTEEKVRAQREKRGREKR